MKPIIERIASEMQLKEENHLCYVASREVGYNVDKDRLAQALTDAKKFYDEGFRAGVGVDIVRCKECCYAEPGDNPDPAAYAFWCSFHDEGTEGDCFCSYGEMRVADGQDR